MKKSTDELLRILKNAKQPKEYFENEKEELNQKTLVQYLEHYMKKYQISKTEIIRKSGLERTYAYQIFSGRKKPSRDKLLAIGISIGLELEEMQSILKCTSYPILYPRVQRDSVFIFALQRKISVMELNDLLFELQLEVLD